MISSSGLVDDVNGEEDVDVRESLGSGGPETVRREVVEDVVFVRFNDAEKNRFAKVVDVDERFRGCGLNDVMVDNGGDIGPRWSSSACWARGQRVYGLSKIPP